MNAKDLIPAHPLETLHRDVDRLFGGLFDDRTLPKWRLVDSGNLPRVDFKDTENGYELDAELPGVGASDVKLDIVNGILTLKVGKKSPQEDKGKNYIRVERSYGSVARSFGLPDDADQEKVAAVSKHGVVAVTIPKKLGVGAQPRSIAIKPAA